MADEINAAVLNEEGISSIRRYLSLAFANTFDGERNTWMSCGYPSGVSDEEMELRYERVGFAQTIVDVYPQECWAKPPVVYETEAKAVTEFEGKWDAMMEDEELQLLTGLKDVDRLAGRGKHAVLLLGFDGGANYEADATGKASRLLYVRAFHPKRVQVAEKDNNPASPRYGKPTIYALSKNMSDDHDTIRVHWTRVVHVADCTDDIDWIGKHRLHRVFNYLLDIEKVVGGGAEMFWKGGFPGMGLSMDREMNPDQTQIDRMDQQVKDYFNGLTRALRLRGVTPTQFDTQVAEPTAHLNMLLGMVSVTTRIPVRVLMGSTMDVAAGDQDTNAWLTRIEDRRVNFCQPKVLIPFVRRCQGAGVLPPLEKLKITWPTLKTKNDKDDADIGRVRTDALARYASTPGMEIVMSVYHYLTVILRLSDTDANEIIAEAAAPYGGTEEGLRKALTDMKKAQLVLKGGEGSGGMGVGTDKLPGTDPSKPRPDDATRRNDGRKV